MNFLIKAILGSFHWDKLDHRYVTVERELAGWRQQANIESSRFTEVSLFVRKWRIGWTLLYCGKFTDRKERTTIAERHGKLSFAQTGAFSFQTRAKWWLTCEINEADDAQEQYTCINPLFFTFPQSDRKEWRKFAFAWSISLLATAQGNLAFIDLYLKLHVPRKIRNANEGGRSISRDRSSKVNGPLDVCSFLLISD